MITLKINANHTNYVHQISQWYDVYVDNIAMTSDNQEEMTRLKKHLAIECKIRDLSQLRHFLWIKVAQPGKNLFLKENMSSTY